MQERLTGEKVYETIQTYPGAQIEIATLADLLQTPQELLSSHLRVLEIFGKIEVDGNIIRSVT